MSLDLTLPPPPALAQAAQPPTPAPGQGAVVVINSDAGSARKHGPSRLRALVRRSAPSDLARVVTTDRHDLRALLLEVAKSQPRLVAVIGGDGTAHSALETLTPLGIAAAPLPGGTMNRLAARVFGRADLAQSLGALGDGAPGWLSGGRVNQFSFYVAAGFGAWMQVQSLRERMRKLRSIAGANALIRMAPRQFADRIAWSCDEAARLDHSTLLVGVGRIDTALGFARERHEPALFEAAGANIRNWGELGLLTVAGLTRRWRRYAGVASLAAREIEIQNNHEGTPALLDGEFHILPRRNAIVFDPACGLTWRPKERRAPW